MASLVPPVTILEEATLSAQEYLALLTNLKRDAVSSMSLARGLRNQVLLVILKDICKAHGTLEPTKTLTEIWANIGKALRKTNAHLQHNPQGAP